MNDKIIIKGKSNYKFFIAAHVISISVLFFILLLILIIEKGILIIFGFPICCIIIPLTISLFNRVFLKYNEIIVTKEKVSLLSPSKGQMDLPFDHISAVAIIPNQKKITVSTSSGVICLNNLDNYNEIYTTINEILGNKSNNRKESTIENKQNNLDDLKKLKELLDSGVITKKEFEAKKKQILDL